MNKECICLKLFSGVCVIGVGITGYFSYKLDIQADRISNLQSKVAILSTDFGKRNPGININALADVAVTKNISSEKTVNAIELLQKSPEQGRVYMKQELKFSPSEMDSVFQPNFQMKKN